MKMFRELRQGDLVSFKKKSGSGSFVKVENKGYYFMPAKIDMRLEGEDKKPIQKNEIFVYSGYKLLLTEEDKRAVRISLVRETTGQLCFISENDLHNYFNFIIRKNSAYGN